MEGSEELDGFWGEDVGVLGRDGAEDLLVVGVGGVGRGGVSRRVCARAWWWRRRRRRDARFCEGALPRRARAFWSQWSAD